MDDIKFLKPDKKHTANHALIKKAFYKGFNEGIAFINESDFDNSNAWRKLAFKEFCEKHKIKF